MRTLLFAVGCVVALWVIVIAAFALAGRPTTAREIASFLPNLAVLFRGLSKEPRVSRGTKILLLVALAWIASPVDLIPEFVPVLGPLDDALVAAFVLRRLVRGAGPVLVAKHWRGSEESLRLILRVAGARPA